jgi:hypothetical protein
MAVTIEELNTKYKAEDENWDFSLFPAWLEKKGIPNTADLPIVATCLEQVLMELKTEDLPDNHHDFDQMVLKRARETKEATNRVLIEKLGQMVEESLKKYDKEWEDLSKWKKVWEVIRGRA